MKKRKARCIQMRMHIYSGYERSLSWSLAHSRFMLLLTLGTIALNVLLYIIVPKGFFPQQDTGRIIGIDTGSTRYFISGNETKVD